MSPTFGQFAYAVVATFGIPLIVLSIEYAIRWTYTDASPDQIQRLCGPDLCILSLGSVGAIFIDPHIEALHWNTSLVIVVDLLIVVLLRVICIRFADESRSSNPTISLWLGCTSIALNTVILSCGFIWGRVAC